MNQEGGEPSGYVFCNICGKAYKRRGIKIHIARSHGSPILDDRLEYEEPNPDLVALSGGPPWLPTAEDWQSMTSGQAGPAPSTPPSASSEHLTSPFHVMLPTEVINSAVVMAPTPTGRNVSYKELTELMRKNEVIVIDVRERTEVKQLGAIPYSVNIPRMELRAALSEISNTEFRRKYGFPIPQKETKLVFTCQSGGRSKAATDLALSLGYTNSYNYPGGYSDWERQHNKR